MAESLSRIPIRIKIIGVGDAEAEFNRLTAPLTVGELVKRLPIGGVAMPGQGSVCVLLGLKRGAEKPVTSVEAGTIAYWPRQGSLCFYPKAGPTYGPVSRVGIIKTNVGLFEGLKTGSRIVVELSSSRSARRP